MTVPWSDSQTNDAKLQAIIAKQLEKAITTKRWKPLAHQIPPEGDWLGWLMLAGRGAGKTAACANYVVSHVHGPPCMSGPIPHWIGIVAPTLGDAATACFSGPAGIRSFDPTATMAQKPGGLVVTWQNGAQAKLFGAREPDDVERLRAGGNTCLIWAEELSSWRYAQDAFDQFRFGLRIGEHPRWIGSTTPKPRPLIKKLYTGGYQNIAVTHATMYDNPHLPAHIKQALEESYGATSLGQQELYGRIIEQDENALWTREVMELTRVSEAPTLLNRITVGVDPSGGSDNQGIIVVGSLAEMDERGKMLKHGYVLDDRTVHSTPDGWGRAAVTAAADWEADCIVVETNFGGDMAINTLVAASEHLGLSIPIKTVRASRGKHPRAEPVSALSVQRRWHHAGMFPELEDEMATWTPDSDWSPNRIDAAVWPAHYMKIVTSILKSVGTFGGSAMSKRSLIPRRS